MGISAREKIGVDNLLDSLLNVENHNFKLKYDDKVEFDWYTSSSLDILKENLIFNDLDYIIGIDEDFPSKMYLKERNLKAYILDLEHKYKTFPSNMYNKIISHLLIKIYV